MGKKWYQKGLRIGADVATLGAYEALRDPGRRAIGKFVGGVWDDLTGKNQAEAGKYGAKLQEEAALKGIEENKRQFDVTQQNLAPWLQTGQRALGSLESQLNSGAYNMPDYQASSFHYSPMDWQNNPAYQFQMQEGTRALDQGAASRGGALGGNQARALTAYGQGLASQNYGEDFGRQLSAYNVNEGNRFGAYQQNANNRQQQFGRYSQLAGIGQQTGGQLAQIGSNYANQNANLYGNIGDAQAGGLIGAANSRAAGTGNLLNAALKTFPLFLK